MKSKTSMIQILNKIMKINLVKVNNKDQFKFQHKKIIKFYN